MSCQAMRRLLHKHRVCVNNDVESILGARVPILKFKDVATGARAEPAQRADSHRITRRHHINPSKGPWRTCSGAWPVRLSHV